MSLKREITRPNLVEMDGLLMFPDKVCNEEVVTAIRTLQLEPGDLVLSTYPKCGTTWMQYIIWGILNEAKELPPLKQINREIFAFLERTGVSDLKDKPHPWLVKVHMPYNYTPHHPQAKYIYVARNLKDCCVSCYHFFKQFPGVFPDAMPFEDYVENFLEGYMGWGDPIDHILSWYEHKDEPNVLFLTYEEMKKDPKTVILKVAKFLGDKYEEQISKDEAILNRILENTSFDKMKKELSYVLVDKEETQHNQVHINVFRKGVVGDWKNIFTEDMEKRFDFLMESRLKNTYLYDLWMGL